MQLLFIAMGILISGTIFATIIHQNIWADWPLRLGLKMMWTGTLLLLIVVLAVMFPGWWEYVVQQISSLSAKVVAIR